MNEGAKKILREYYFAYRHANGARRARRFRFRYKRGWVRFGGKHTIRVLFSPSYRLRQLKEWTKVLNNRPAFEE